MIMLQLNACPRCKGALDYQQDRYGSYRSCLNCGFLHDLIPQGTPAVPGPPPRGTFDHWGVKAPQGKPKAPKTPSEVGIWLKEQRKRYGWSRAFLGELVGVSDSAILAYETGKYRVPPEREARFREIFGLG